MILFQGNGNYSLQTFLQYISTKIMSTKPVQSLVFTTKSAVIPPQRINLTMGRGLKLHVETG